MKYLALDYGQKKVGVAVTDPEGRMAFPRCTLLRTTRAAFFEELLALLEAEKPDAVIVGYPLHVDGTECLATRQCRNFADSLKRRISIPLFWMEEVLSSFEAESDLRDAGVDLGRARKVVDQQAAVRILESFLSQADHQRKPA